MQVSQSAVVMAERHGRSMTIRVFRRTVKCCAFELVPVVEPGEPDAHDTGLVIRHWQGIRIYCPDWLDDSSWNTMTIDVPQWAPPLGPRLVIKGWRPSPWPLYEQRLL